MITLSWWTDLDAIRAFAGDDIEIAKYYLEDDDYLSTGRPPLRTSHVAPRSSFLADGDRATAE